MLEAAVPKLIEYGAGGVMIVLLLWAIKKLVDVINRREVDIADLQAEIRELQEKRIAEAMKSVSVLEEASETIEHNVSVLRNVERALGSFDQGLLRAIERVRGRRGSGGA